MFVIDMDIMSELVLGRRAQADGYSECEQDGDGIDFVWTGICGHEIK
jgi:hypothetical protein